MFVLMAIEATSALFASAALPDRGGVLRTDGLESISDGGQFSVELMGESPRLGSLFVEPKHSVIPVAYVLVRLGEFVVDASCVGFWHDDS